MLESVKEGEGAFNYIMQDETAVMKIDATLINIKESTRLFNENMEALKHNFLFRGYFKKLERQKKRDEKKRN